MTDVTGWLAPEERVAWRALSLMHRQLIAALGCELATVGLSYPDYSVLAALAERGDGRARVVELGDQLGWEKSRASHHVSRMHERGLVNKERCPTDHRGSYVVLTAEGRRAAERAAPVHARVVRRHFVDLVTPAQLRTVRDVADVVLARLAAARG